MNDSKVETISRLAQWKIESFGPGTFRKSDSFKKRNSTGGAKISFPGSGSRICPLPLSSGLLVVVLTGMIRDFIKTGANAQNVQKNSWLMRFLSVEKNRYMYIRLYPEPCRLSKEQPPMARFILRVCNVGGNRRPYISPGL
ncbi:BTB/POZ domain-containing protein [Acorus gramineus]|uniref:BTB/POZ domain-containing protein n=1 Tax=Acorus gramineus TaxID=55184 RepID=A0AAV9A2Y7_ACOGR|nr:BTB/POZ domain-containing protein [Acorus gramineus]